MKIPKIQFDKLKRQDKPEQQEAHEESSDSAETVTQATIEVSEATLKKVWAGEIAAAVLLAFVSVIVAFIS